MLRAVHRFIVRLRFAFTFGKYTRLARFAERRRNTQAVHAARTAKQDALHARLRAELGR